MKIKKIKSQGEYCYPATIAAAVKDANFQKEDGTVMTLGEINLELKGPKILLDVVFSDVGNPNIGLTVDDKYYSPSSLETGKRYTFKDFSLFKSTDAQFSRFDITYGPGVTSVPVTGFYIARSAWKDNWYASFISQVDVSKLDTSAVTDMTGMFAGCRFVRHLDLYTFDTKRVGKMTNMFNGCESLKYLDLRSFDFSNVYEARGMFRGCKSLEEIYPNNLSDTKFDLSTPGTSFDHMFLGCESLKYINMSFVSSVRGLSLIQFFDGCKSLRESYPFTRDFMYEVGYVSCMYRNCSSLTRLALNKMSTEYCPDVTDMLKGCTSLGDITFGEGWGKGSNVLILDLCDCNSSGNYVLSANTWESMLTMYDRKSAGGNLFIIRLNSKHIPNSGSNVPENWKENMAARGYTISEVEA